MTDAEAAAGAKPLTLYDQVRIRASDYSVALPNFICEQLIRRSHSSNFGKTWKHRDTVTVEVMMADGKEDYGNVRRNSRKVDWQKVKDTGTWSLGEYGTILVDILHPATNAEFTKRGDDKIGTQVFEVHDYVVQKENSHWKVDFEGRRYQPKYRGALWIDPKDHMVHRIEMESLNMPADYPVRHAEMTLHYGSVKIGEEWYLLPLRSENLACFTGTSNCTKNEIDFRNYRKFSTESNVSTTESTITFDGEEKAPPKKK